MGDPHAIGWGVDWGQHGVIETRASLTPIKTAGRRRTVGGWDRSFEFAILTVASAAGVSRSGLIGVFLIHEIPPDSGPVVSGHSAGARRFVDPTSSHIPVGRLAHILGSGFALPKRCTGDQKCLVQRRSAFSWDGPVSGWPACPPGTAFAGRRNDSRRGPTHWNSPIANTGAASLRGRGEVSSLGELLLWRAAWFQSIVEGRFWDR